MRNRIHQEPPRDGSSLDLVERQLTVWRRTHNVAARALWPWGAQYPWPLPVMKKGRSSRPKSMGVS
jgi:hypothetical protein